MGLVFRDGRGGLVTQRMLDEAIGAPTGVALLQLSIPSDGPLVLSLVADRRNGRVDRKELEEKISEKLRLRLRAELVDELPLAKELVTISRDAGPSPRFLADVEAHFLRG